MNPERRPDSAVEVTDDAVLGGRLRLLQPRRGHRVGHDAILLAAATAAGPGEVAVDLGAGVGAAGLALAVRAPAALVRLVEIDPILAGLAADNAIRNGLGGRVSAHALDVDGDPAAFAAAGLGPGSARRVLMNPPFNDPARLAISPDLGRRGAHVGDRAQLSRWIVVASRMLSDGGVLTLIHRADGLADVLAVLMEAGFGGVAVMPVHARPDSPAIRVLVRALKGGRAPFALLPPLVLQDIDGRPSAAAEAVLRDCAELPLARLG